MSAPDGWRARLEPCRATTCRGVGDSAGQWNLENGPRTRGQTCWGNQDGKGDFTSLMFPLTKGIFAPADKCSKGAPSGPPAYANNPVVPWPCKSRGGTPTGRTEPLSAVADSRRESRVQLPVRKDLQHSCHSSSVPCWESGMGFRFKKHREVYRS